MLSLLFLLWFIGLEGAVLVNLGIRWDRPGFWSLYLILVAVYLVGRLMKD